MESDCSIASLQDLRIAVVIPCYRVKAQILNVVSAIGPEVWRIYIIDDACPEQSGVFVEQQCEDPRVVVMYHPTNEGVGGAAMSGYRQALTDGAAVVVKIDGDGQMDPALIPRFVAPIIEGIADYTKGNRFFDLDGLAQMPWIRILGNAALSFFSKLSTGYWDVMDPTNGYTAIDGTVLAQLPLTKVSRGFFFESDMLFRLNTLKAVVLDIPMAARYGTERSNLVIHRIAAQFVLRHVTNLGKRIFYNYFLRDTSIASLELVVGLAMILFSGIFGISEWTRVGAMGVAAPSGTVMLAALPTIIGIQFLISFLNYDIANQPRLPLKRRLGVIDHSMLRLKTDQDRPPPAGGQGRG